MELRNNFIRTTVYFILAYTDMVHIKVDKISFQGVNKAPIQELVHSKVKDITSISH